MTNETTARVQAEDRKRYVEAAHAWTARQAERLQVQPEDIDQAIRRGGWLASEIEDVASPAELQRRRR